MKTWETSVEADRQAEQGREEIDVLRRLESYLDERTDHSAAKIEPATELVAKFQLMPERTKDFVQLAVRIVLKRRYQPVAILDADQHAIGIVGLRIVELIFEDPVGPALWL